LTTYQMGLALTTLLIVTDLEGVTAIARDATAAIALVVGLGLLGTGLAYILYYYIVDRLGAVTASSATYIPPVVALAIGWQLVNEPLDWLDGLAVALILAGVVVLQLGGAATRHRLKRWRGVAQQSSGVGRARRAEARRNRGYP
jgi:drug/metabolite transporter (DMT)-like permease